MRRRNYQSLTGGKSTSSAEYGALNNYQTSNYQTGLKYQDKESNGYGSQNGGYGGYGQNGGSDQSGYSGGYGGDLSMKMGSIKGDSYYKAQKEKVDQKVWVVEAIKEMINLLYSTITGSKGNDFEEAEIVVPEEQLEKLRKFRQIATQPYDKHNKLHKKKLFAFWKVCFPNEKISGEVSPQWKECGFQQKDPSSDFRAVGVFGLQCNLFFSTRYPRTFKRMFRKNSKEANGYPFAIASFNVVVMLFQILGFKILGGGGSEGSNLRVNQQAKKSFIDLLAESDKPFRSIGLLDDEAESEEWDWDGEIEEKSPVPQKVVKLISFDDDEDEPTFDEKPPSPKPKPQKKKDTSFSHKRFNLAFEEVFVHSFIYLHHLWYRKNSSYFQFHEVLKETRKYIEHKIETELFEVQDVRDANRKLELRLKKK